MWLKDYVAQNALYRPDKATIQRFDLWPKPYPLFRSAVAKLRVCIEPSKTPQHFDSRQNSGRHGTLGNPPPFTSSSCCSKHTRQHRYPNEWRLKQTPSACYKQTALPRNLQSGQLQPSAHQLQDTNPSVEQQSDPSCQTSSVCNQKAAGIRSQCADTTNAKIRSVYMHGMHTITHQS
jgi:hypothetical protein